MAVVACTGFEFGQHSTSSGALTTDAAGRKMFDGVVGTLGSTVSVTASAARAAHSAYGLRIAYSAATNLNVNWLAATLGSLTSVVGSFYVRVSATPATTLTLITAVYGNVFNMEIYWGSDNKLYGHPEGQTPVAGPTVATGAWHLVEFYVNTVTTTETMDWRVNGVDQTQVVVADTGTANDPATGVYIGSISTSATYTGNVDYDDVAVSGASGDYPLGGQKLVLLKPDTGGTTTEIGTANATSRFVTNSTANATHNSADILAATSEVPPLIGSTASGVCQRTAGTGNACGIPMTTYTLAAGETISGMRHVLLGWAATGTANSFGWRSYNGANETVLFAAADPAFDASTTVPQWWCQMAGAGLFDTQGELDAFLYRVGYSNGDVNPVPGFHALYAELAVKESTA